MVKREDMALAIFLYHIVAGEHNRAVRSGVRKCWRVFNEKGEEILCSMKGVYAVEAALDHICVLYHGDEFVFAHGDVQWRMGETKLHDRKGGSKCF